MCFVTGFPDALRAGIGVDGKQGLSRILFANVAVGNSNYPFQISNSTSSRRGLLRLSTVEVTSRYEPD